MSEDFKKFLRKIPDWNRVAAWASTF